MGNLCVVCCWVRRKNSLLTDVSPSRWIARHITERENILLILTHNVRPGQSLSRRISRAHLDEVQMHIPHKMNWPLIFQLSLFGLAMGVGTIFFISSRIEPILW